MNNTVRKAFGISLLVFVFGAYVKNVFLSPSGQSEQASTGTEYETRQSCGEERNYLENDLALIDPILRLSRLDDSSEQILPKKCVTHIMKNFASLETPLSFRAQCRDEKGAPILAPVRKHGEKGFKAACVTETYVNSTYHALVDVADCFNIPIKELMPKLFNESGLHTNSLGGGFDAGVGQLTSGALKEDVFERYNGDAHNPSAFEWYVAEMKKSSKASCQRIAQIPSSYEFDIPKGMKLCSKEEAQGDDQCFKVWDAANRCQFISAPENPLRNILVMAMLYRNNMKNATGVTFVAGDDYLAGQMMQKETPYGGYFKKHQFVERLKALGVVGVDQEVVKQIILGLGFNAGISTPKNILEDYLTYREKNKKRLSKSDIDFQSTDTGKWAFATNPVTFWKGLTSEADADFQKLITGVEGLSGLGIDHKKIAKMLKEERKAVRKQLSKIGNDEAALLKLKTKVDGKRGDILKTLSAKAGALTLPEYMRIAHAYMIVDSKRIGGAPGYLSFLAKKYKDLEVEMGTSVCGPEKYLKF